MLVPVQSKGHKRTGLAKEKRLLAEDKMTALGCCRSYSLVTNKFAQRDFNRQDQGKHRQLQNSQQESRLPLLHNTLSLPGSFLGQMVTRLPFLTQLCPTSNPHTDTNSLAECPGSSFWAHLAHRCKGCTVLAELIVAS